MAPITQLILSLLPLSSSFLSPSSSPLADSRAPSSPLPPSVTSLDAWITTQRRVAVDSVFRNIGQAAGASPGVVIASPSTSNPDYFFTWTRDAALTASGLLSQFSSSPSSIDNLGTDFEDRTLSFLTDYVDAQTVLQGLDTLSGTAASLETLAEPKFYTNLTRFDGEWGRPQRDGPALRATTVMQYLDYLNSTSSSSPLRQLTHSKAINLIRNDLDYVASHWNLTSFDLWEEVLSSSYFTAASHLRALQHGSNFFSRLGDSDRAKRYSEAGRKVRCFVEREFVAMDEEGRRFVRSNMNVENGARRGGVDANSILATLLPSPPLSTPSCSTILSPCSPLALSNLHLFLSSFPRFSPSSSSSSSLLSLKPSPLGRYPEDTYFGGNPWVLTTLAAAEQLWRAVESWERVGSVEVGKVDGGFWAGVVGRTVERRAYEKGGEEYEELLGKVRGFADGLLEIVKDVTPESGRMDEQWDVETGKGTGAKELTWSYIAFLTATSARSRALSFSSTSSSPSCLAQIHLTRSPIPISSDEGIDDGLLQCPKRSSYNGTMSIRFEVETRTEWSESILIAGSSPSLGSWSPSSALALSPANYTRAHPVWLTENAVEIEGRTGVEWKIVKKWRDGSFSWERGENRIFYTSSDGERVISVKWSV